MSDGKIHSYKIRSVYQEHTIRFVKWVREQYHIISLLSNWIHAPTN